MKTEERVTGEANKRKEGGAEETNDEVLSARQRRWGQMVEKGRTPMVSPSGVIFRCSFPKP